jgi:hypothetical protein
MAQHPLANSLAPPRSMEECGIVLRVPSPSRALLGTSSVQVASKCATEYDLDKVLVEHLNRSLSKLRLERLTLRILDGWITNHSFVSQTNALMYPCHKHSYDLLFRVLG